MENGQAENDETETHIETGDRLIEHGFIYQLRDDAYRKKYLPSGGCG